jgi:hypothetical protein
VSYSDHLHDGRYYTEIEIDTKTNDINKKIDDSIKALSTNLTVTNNNLSSTNTKVNNIGQSAEAYPSGTYNFGANTYLDICGLTLPSGTYIIWGQIGTFTPTDMSGIAFMNWNNTVTYKENCRNNSIIMYTILNETTNIKLRAKITFNYSTGGLSATRDYIQAVRIK